MFIEKHVVNIFYLSIYVGFYPKFLVHNSLSKTGHTTRISFPQAESQKFQYSPALELPTTKNFSDLPYLKEDGEGVLLQQQSYSISKRRNATCTGQILNRQAFLGFSTKSTSIICYPFSPMTLKTVVHASVHVYALKSP